MDFITHHTRVFWGQAHAPHVRHFRLTPHVPDAPAYIDVVTSVMGDCLQLSYFCDGDDDVKAHFKKYDTPDKLIRADFLWEKTCFECFFDVANSSSNDYFELNFCPTGAYNLYHFDDYRTPCTLPPKQADGLVFLSNTHKVLGDLSFHLGVKIDNIRTSSIKKINPTAIIYHHDTSYFYATEHANPPDFHDKGVWQDF